MELLGQLAAAIGERYRVERELGHGGMAVVFLAEDLKHHRRVAIKVLKPELSVALGGDRFLREIEIAAALQHPHILPLYDSGQAGSLLYYVMPFAEGESLRQRIAREGPLPLDAALQITREVGSALQYAHERGFIHRDIKPENIMLSGGQAVVADFGIARALSAASTDQLTQSGIVVGTPQYMSPEQASSSPVDGRSDQYSLACTLYEMLIGQPPFTGPSSQAVMIRHSLEPVPPLRLVRETVSPTMEGAIVRAMAKLPADRFVSMQRFVDALASPEYTSHPERTSLTTPAWSGHPRRERGRLISALGLAVLVGAVAWRFVTGRTASPSAPVGPTVTSVAVLPFQDLGGSQDSSYLAEGITEGLVSDMAEIGSLKVISRSSGAVAQGMARPLGELAGDLGVQAVVKGSIRRAGDTVLVSVRFVRAPDSTVLFTRDYRGRLGELPNLQREITAAITGSISARLKGTEQSRLDVRREVDQRAYDAYLRGRFHLDLGDMEQARAMFERAGKLAPDWAPPYIGLANYYTSLPFLTMWRRPKYYLRPGRRWFRRCSSTRPWPKPTRTTRTSGPTTSGTGARRSRNTDAPWSCDRATPMRTSPTAVFSRRAGGSMRRSRSSSARSSWTPCRYRCRRIEPCSTTSEATIPKPMRDCGRFSRATRPT